MGIKRGRKWEQLSLIPTGSQERPEASDASRKVHRELAASQAECKRLQKENEHLRKMIGLSAEVVSPYSPLPFAPSVVVHEPSAPTVDSHSSIAEKVALFWKLFRGREDVYAVMWTDKETGKIGYSPAKRTRWRGKQTGENEYLPLSGEVITRHLSGELTVGVFPLLLDDTCWFLACDFDGPEWAEDALGYVERCRRHGVPAYLERSRSGNGGHAWIFFSNPVSAASARRLGMSLLRETMASRSELSLSSYDRFFPNQDFLPKGGFGNLIALPLQKHRRADGNTEFLDPATLKPWPDQWSFLSTVKRFSPEQIETLIGIIPPVRVGADTAILDGASSIPATVAPTVLPCTLRASIGIEKAGLPGSLLSEMKHLASLHNPLFYERLKLRLSTHQTPRFITCYDQDVTSLYLPRGLLEQISSAVSKAGYRLHVNDVRTFPEDMPFEFKGTLAPHQKEAVDAVLAHDQGILVAPPGAGKTVMGCYILAARRKPTIILTHRKPLLEQWRLQLVNLLGLSPKEIGQIGGGLDKRTGKIDLAMIQSLKDFPDMDSFFSRYGLVIVDECHHIPAVSFEAVIKKAPVKYILGLTATPYRRDGLQELMVMQCGRVRYSIPSRNGLENDLELDLLIRKTSSRFETKQDASIQEIFRGLVDDTDRSVQICNDILQALDLGRRCLVLSQWKEHCQILARIMASHGKRALLLDGSLRKKERNALLEEIRGMPAERDLLIMATGQYLGEGFDCPQLDTLFLAFPVSFKGRLVQYVGRLMRHYEGKLSVRVYDYADMEFPVLKKMHERRLRTYKGMGFQLP